MDNCEHRKELWLSGGTAHKLLRVMMRVAYTSRCEECESRDFLRNGSRSCGF